MKNTFFVAFLLGSMLLMPSLSATNIEVPLYQGRGGFGYAYGDWQDKLDEVQTKKEDSVHLQGSSRGGVGLMMPSTKDLSECKYLTLKVKLGGGTDSSMMLVLHDIKGGRNQFKVNLRESVPAGADDAVIVVIDIAEQGIDPTKLEEIKQIQLQGVFTPGASIDLEVFYIKAVATKPE